MEVTVCLFVPVSISLFVIALTSHCGRHKGNLEYIGYGRYLGNTKVLLFRMLAII